MDAALVGLLLGLVDRAAAVSSLLAKTRAEGRQPSAEELDALFAADDTARAKLEEDIRVARAARVTG